MPYLFDERTPLHFASKNGHLQVVKFLVDHGSKINAISMVCETPLSLAAKNGHYEIVEYFISKRAKINTQYLSLGGYFVSTPLEFATFYGHISIVRLLLSNGARINYGENEEEGQSLHIASQQGYLPIVELLLSHGAKVNSEFEYETPLDYSLNNNHLEIADLLELNGGKTNSVHMNFLYLAFNFLIFFPSSY